MCTQLPRSKTQPVEIVKPSFLLKILIHFEIDLFKDYISEPKSLMVCLASLGVVSSSSGSKVRSRSVPHFSVSSESIRVLQSSNQSSGAVPIQRKSRRDNVENLDDVEASLPTQVDFRGEVSEEETDIDKVILPADDISNESPLVNFENITDDEKYRQISTSSKTISHG